MNGRNKKMLYAVLLAAMTVCFITACGKSSPKQVSKMEEKDMDSITQYQWTSKEISCNIGSQSIYGIAYIPEKEGKFPLVIFAHELCNTHTAGIDYAKSLAAAGIAAYTFDFRGGSAGSRSDGKTTEMSVMTEADDLDAVMRCAKEWDFVDSERVVLLGGSQGGAAAAVAAERNEDQVAGLILLYPAFVIYDEVHTQFHSLEDVPDNFDFLGWIQVGRNYVSDIWDYDNYGNMENYEKPVLLIHGDRDFTVDISYSERAAESYPDADLQVIKGAGHGFYGESFEEAMQYIFGYLKEIGILE